MKSLPRRLHVLCATLRKILKVSIRKKKINHISNQSVEQIKEILVYDGITELELETDSLEDDLSNAETPEDAQRIGCVELPKSDSVRNEALQATVMYVESDDIGDSGMVNICFGDDDDLTELHEFELDTDLIDDSTCGLCQINAHQKI